MMGKSTWGGARQGAGAKRKGSAARVVLSCRVKPETATAARRAAEESGQSVGEYLDSLINP